MGDAPLNLGWTLGELATELSGELVGPDATVARVSTDTRSDLSDALFVAVRGERFDGNTFAGDAIEQGAVAVVVDADANVDVEPRIVVPDTAEALLGLAAKRRAELTMPVVAITGSTGKTSTKDLIAAGIDGAWASPRSFNNEIGVPLTVLGTPDDATALVLEVGSRGKGHIEWLGKGIDPDVAVVTNLGVVHLETFGSEEGLADAKYELIAMLGDGGTAIVPADEPRLRRGTSAREITFGAGSADVSFGDVALDAVGRPSFSLVVGDAIHDVSLGVAGSHQALNAAAACGVAVALGLDLEAFAASMASTSGSDWRMDVHTGRYTVVNDAYNANPQSIEAALRTVVEMDGNHTIAVLGPMAELGSVCEREHMRIGGLACELGIDHLIVVGPDHGYVLGAAPIVANAAGFEEAADTLHAIVEPGDVVLVKASRAAGLERLAIALVEDSAT
ncbi:MAG: UDP-N-acetylmuramoyl-tripeptide--D-alanyl-D-alanine ligase [Acidimicrobiia bacterium]